MNNMVDVKKEDKVIPYDNDVCFKYYFGETDIDSQFLRNALCEYAIGGDVHILTSEINNVEILPEQLGDKKIVLDISAKDVNGRLYAIEMQRHPTDIDTNRWEYYGARNLSKQLKKSYDYLGIPPVYQIIFTHRYAYENKEMLNRYVMRNDFGQKEQEHPLLNRIYVNILAIDKIVKEKGIANLNEFEKIVYLFKNGKPCDTMNPGKMVKVIMERYEDLKKDSTKWDLAVKLEEAETREQCVQEISRKLGKEEGLKEGIEKGLKKGTEKGKAELLQQQISLKYHIDESTWLTSLTFDQLDNIALLILTCDTFAELQRQVNQ